ncbi:MAG: hypothetical protein GJT30_13060 [Geobacter sp.]|nr:hypothetical protein [Geobacter sp.]
MKGRFFRPLVSLAVVFSISFGMLGQVATDADGIRHIERTCAAIEEGINQLSPAPAILVGNLVKVVYSPRFDRLLQHRAQEDGSSVAVACRLARASPLG